MHKKNFTILELLAVCVVISILLAITIGVYSLVRDKMNNSKTRAIIKQLDIAMQSYKIDEGYYISQPTIYTSFTSSTTPPFYGLNPTYIFKLNYGGAVDTTFIKNFEYQSLVGSGNIKTNGTAYSYIVDAWSRPLIYSTSSSSFNSSMFDIGSLGKDGYYGDKSLNPSNNSSEFGKGDDITNFNNN